MVTSYELILPSGDMLVLFAYTGNGFLETSYHRAIEIAYELNARIRTVI